MAIIADLMAYVSALRPSTEIDPKDGMYGGHDQHYFGVGRSAILMILTALTARLSYTGGDAPVRTILDFGGGHGRVARYLRAAFPESRVEVTDFYRPGVEFCIDQLGCHDMGAEVPADRYDLIWVGSVFTHLPAEKTIGLLASLKGALRKGGLVVLTTGGRLGLANLEGFLSGRTGIQYSGYGLSKEGAAAIAEAFLTTGYGYHDYPNQIGYGGSLNTPGWMFRHALDEQTLQIMYQEMGWDTHQDVYAFMRIGVDGMTGVGRGPYFSTADPFAEAGGRPRDPKQLTQPEGIAVLDASDQDAMSIDDKYVELRKAVAGYLETHKKFHRRIFDGAPAVPRPELLTHCRVLNDRYEIIRRLPKGKIFAEVGTLTGDFIVRVLELCEPSELHLFDFGFNNLRSENRAILDKFGKAHYHIGNSSKQLSSLADNYFDVIYVDADHSYQGVLKDLEQAIKKVKPDGYIICNDYTNFDPIQVMPYGVYAAVNRFANENNLVFEFIALSAMGFHDVALRRADVLTAASSNQR